MSSLSPGAGSERGMWRFSDGALLLVLNGVALVLIGVAWRQSADRTVLADQASTVALAAGGLIVGAVGDALFVLAGKREVAWRAKALLRPVGTDIGAEPAPSLLVDVAAPPRLRAMVAPSASPSRDRRVHHRDRILAVAAAVAGGSALLAGWLGLSTVPADAGQVPWVVGGSFLGLWLAGLAGTAWLSAALRDQWASLSRIGDWLRGLGVSSVADISAPCSIDLRGKSGDPSVL